MKTKSLPLLAFGLGLGLGLGISSASAGHRSFGDGLPKYLQEFDVNDDGLIDEEERQAVRTARAARHEERIAKWDTDEDGMLSDEEKRDAREAIRAEIEAKRSERFTELAGDDVLTLDEFSAIPGLEDVDPERVAALFSRLDADDSGEVTLEEFTARLRHHRRPGAHRPHRPHRPRH